MSTSVRPQRWQPTGLPHPWDSPGKNTGVGCHFLLQCMKVKSEREVAQSCPTLRDPMGCSPPGSSAHGTFQSRVLESGAIAFSEERGTLTLKNGLGKGKQKERKDTIATTTYQKRGHMGKRRKKYRLKLFLLLRAYLRPRGRIRQLFWFTMRERFLPIVSV